MRCCLRCRVEEPLSQQEQKSTSCDSFKLFYPKKGPSSDVAFLAHNEEKSILEWDKTSDHAFYELLKQAAQVTNNNWRMHAKGDHQVCLLQLSRGFTKKIIEDTIFEGGNLRRSGKLFQTLKKNTSPTYGSRENTITSLETLSIATPRILLDKERVQVVYPEQPIDIDGQAQHFYVVAKQKSLHELDQSLFHQMMEMVRIVAKAIFESNEHHILLLGGGTLQGRVAPTPFHIEVIIYYKNAAKNQESFQRVLNMQFVPIINYDEKMQTFKDLLEEGDSA